MKKLLTVIAALAIMVMPFAKVNAEDFDIKKGTAVSFKTSKAVPDSSTDPKQIQTLIAMDNVTFDQQNVRVWSGPSYVLLASQNPDITLFNADGTQNTAGALTIQDMLVSVVNNVSGEYMVGTTKEDLLIPSFDQLLSIFTTTQAGDVYTIDLETNKAVMTWLSIATQQNSSEGKLLKGFITSTTVDDKVWVLDFDLDTEGRITAARFTKVPANTTDYAYSFIGLADKSFRCGQKACYLCDDKYVYNTSDNVDATCTLVADKDVNSCVNISKTGVKEYILEGLAITGICVIVLAVIKRKDAFRSI